MLDQRGRLLRTALGFAGLPRPSYDRALWALRFWLDSWAGIGAITTPPGRQRPRIVELGQGIPCRHDGGCVRDEVVAWLSRPIQKQLEQDDRRTDEPRRERSMKKVGRGSESALPSRGSRPLRRQGDFALRRRDTQSRQDSQLYRVVVDKFSGRHFARPPFYEMDLDGDSLDSCLVDHNHIPLWSAQGVS